ncbi:MAG: M57 family metalloprotease [Flavisolibacter sp.]
MKNILTVLAVAGLSAMAIYGCKKDTRQATTDEISQETLSRIQALGFGTSSVQRHEDGYLVEGDIILTPELLNSVPSSQFLRVGNEEQYRTTNLVKANGGRTITVALSGKLPSSYGAALDIMVQRYNAQKLLLTFQRVSSGANITFDAGHGSYLASSGFPTSSGDPYNSVKVNAQAIGAGNGSSTFNNYLATIFAHEVGHCIGFRHTDYMDRSYSCGGSPTNEGASTVGAIQIPGTPSGPDPNSWMLACIGSGQDRPFNSNDKTALNYLY